MGFIFEILVEFVFGFVLELLAEIAFEFGFSALFKSIYQAKNNPVVFSIIYLIVGVVLGLLSLFIFPEFTDNKTLRTLNLVFSPILLGLSLSFLSWIISRDFDDRGLFNLRKFIYGFAFGMGFSLVRFLYT